MTVPSKKAITQVAGKYRGSSWVSKHTLCPYPVYVAELADGTTRRMSFWQEAGKPWDFDRGRKLCGDFTYWTRGYIEHDGQHQEVVQTPLGRGAAGLNNGHGSHHLGERLLGAGGELAEEFKILCHHGHGRGHSPRHAL